MRPLTADPGAGCAFLSGGGEMGRRVRRHPWADTPLGEPVRWPLPLQTLVAVTLGANQPMFIAWGDQHTLLYNDAYAELLGDKHDTALGRPLLEVWREIRPHLEPIVERAYAGESVHMNDLRFVMERHGYPAEAYFTFSYTPVRDEQGQVAGFFCPCLETTRQVQTERRRAEDTARQRRLFERAPGFITILQGPEHRFEFANLAYAKLTGDRDLLGRSVREVFPELAGQDFFERLDQVYRSGERYIAQRNPIRLNQTPGSAPELRYLDFIYEPVTNELGAVTGIFVEGHDVTDAYMAQEALYTSEQTFSALTQAMPNHVWTAPAGGLLDWFNPHCYQYSGAAQGELDGHGWTRHVHPDDLPSALQRWNAALATGTPYEAELRLRRHDGAYRWHLSRAVPIQDDTTTLSRWIGTHTDIHDQKQAAQALRELNDTLEMRVEARTAERDRVWRNSRDLLAIFDTQGVFHAVNPAWQEILGYTPAELTGRSFREFVWPPDRALTEQRLALAATQALTSFESRYRHKDGTPRWISWQSSVEGQQIYAYGRHISAEKAQADALRETEELLRQAQKMEAVGQLTGGIAHDFNNLLGGILGSLELIQLRIDQGRLESLPRYTRNAMNSAQRAAALTHRLLAFARRQPLDPKPVDANQLVRDMQDLLRGTLGPTHSLALTTAESLWPTLCDPNQLESAILNLALNARDAMPQGGTLSIETANTEVDRSSADLVNLPPGQYVTLSIRDTGTGMPAEVAARACEPFFTTKPQGQGTGLGLSMVYGFVKQSEGHLQLSSEPGKGTCVQIHLPRHAGSLEQEAGEQRDARVRASADKTVLLVEDDPVLRNLVGEVLQDLGYHTLAAADGPSGLNILDTHRGIDLLITDIGLPGINGHQLAKLATHKHAHLKVLFITGYAEDATSASGFLGPAMQMITKPFAITTLASRIEEMLSQPLDAS
ncbi:MAG: PAS domain S-box protein [Pseudomonas sp.]|uniref:hybrid sensor histidine kinase/response regulator n=1 Tax=Pseudomonas sp. TaxID=306 RepID=UPI0033922E2E